MPTNLPINGTPSSGGGSGAVDSVNGRTGDVTLNKTDVTLSNVDNTADLAKPISTATQTALSGKAASAHTHATTDVSGLDTALSGKAALVHNHVTSDVTGLDTALNGKVGTGDTRLSDAREWTEATVPQAEAEAGTATTRRAWTSERVRQAIAAWWGGIVGTVVQQSDIGTAPNEIPLNQYLGEMAYQNYNAVQITGGKIGGVAISDIARTVLTREELDTINSSTNLTLRGGGVNLLTYSEQFDNAAWSKNRVTVIANATVAPDGTLSADRLVEDTTTGSHNAIRLGFSFTASTTYTVSFYAKPAGRNFVALRTSGSAFSSALLYFNLTTGTVTVINAGGVTASSATSVGNGWYRCVATFTATSTTIDNLIFDAAQDTSNFTYTGDGTSGIYIWGAQLVSGTEPGPYTKTEADAITTAAPALIDAPLGTALAIKSGTVPVRRGDMSFELASDTSLIVKVKGSDGIVRSTTLTLA